MPDSVSVSLDALLADPSRVADVSAPDAVVLMGSLGALMQLLAARAVSGVPAQLAPTPASPPDRLLTPREAATRLSVEVRWLYRHADQLPFTRRLGPRTLRFSEAGIARYMVEKKPLNRARTYA